MEYFKKVFTELSKIDSNYIELVELLNSNNLSQLKDLMSKLTINVYNLFITLFSASIAKEEVKDIDSLIDSFVEFMKIDIKSNLEQIPTSHNELDRTDSK